MSGPDITNGQVPANGPAGLGPWAARMQPATWRKLKFVVLASRIERGRRTAIHEYAYKDVVWVEDLGRGKRLISFTAFLIGDDVFDQRDKFSAACDQPGHGPLVHPSLGSIDVVNVSFTASESAERGRVVDLELSFIETGQNIPLTPTKAISTQSNTTLAATNADAVSASDYSNSTVPHFARGASVVSSATRIAGGWARLATAAISDAGLVASAVTGLPDIFGGRYASGSLATPQPAGTTVASAIATLTTNRQQTAADVAALGVATSVSLPGLIQAVAADVLVTAIDPADQIRLIAPMCQYSPTLDDSTAPIGGAIQAAQTATSSLCRRAAISALARATAAYQPSSYNDAAAIIGQVMTLMDTEIVSAADLGDTASYLALQALRTAVVDDLITRGGSLPQLVTVTRATSLPSLVLAYQLYGDATRSDELIARVNPPAPLFMPTTFRAPSK